MHFRSLSSGFFLFGTGGIINYLSTSTISSLLLGLLFYGLSIFFFFKYRDFKRHEANNDITDDVKEDMKK